MPLAAYIAASSAVSPAPLRADLAALLGDLELRRLGLAGDRVVLPHRHRERARGEPGEPARTTAVEASPALPAAVPPATPAIRATLETSPSMAPNSAGRSQPPVTSACSCWISSTTSSGSRPGQVGADLVEVGGTSAGSVGWFVACWGRVSLTAPR